MVEQFTVFGAFGQPNSVRSSGYLPEMQKTDTRKTLWENVLSLMEAHYGKSNLSRLTSELKWSPADGTRLKEQVTSIGIKKVQELAEHFGLDAWQLIVPGLNPKAPPRLAAHDWPFRRIEKALFDSLHERDKGYIEAQIAAAIHECLASNNDTNAIQGNPDDKSAIGQLNKSSGLPGKALPDALGGSAETKRAIDATSQSDLVPVKTKSKGRGDAKSAPESGHERRGG